MAEGAGDGRKSLSSVSVSGFTEFGHLNRGDMPPQNITGASMKKKKEISAEFKRESAPTGL